jgi:Protein of unknown function (DUF664)
VPKLVGSELETAISFLDFQREVIAIKCDGVDEGQLRTVAVPSGTNLLGMVAHLIVGERYWFGYQLAGEEPPTTWDFRMDAPDLPSAEVLADYRRIWERSNELIRQIGDPDALTAREIDGRPLPMRWVLAHMTTETARHAGHADIIRERIDGETGR